jgi:hypothetical protein
VYGSALFVVAGADDVHGHLTGMALGGLGFGMYVAVDVALAVDVLPDPDRAGKDLAVLNIAGAYGSRSRLPSPPESCTWAARVTASCSPSPTAARSLEPHPFFRSSQFADRPDHRMVCALRHGRPQCTRRRRWSVPRLMRSRNPRLRRIGGTSSLEEGESGCPLPAA